MLITILWSIEFKKLIENTNQSMKNQQRIDPMIMNYDKINMTLIFLGTSEKEVNNIKCLLEKYQKIE